MGRAAKRKNPVKSTTSKAKKTKLNVPSPPSSCESSENSSAASSMEPNAINGIIPIACIKPDFYGNGKSSVGVIINVLKTKTLNGKPYALTTISDTTGNIDIFNWSRTLPKAEKTLIVGNEIRVDYTTNNIKEDRKQERGNKFCLYDVQFTKLAQSLIVLHRELIGIKRNLRTFEEIANGDAEEEKIDDGQCFDFVARKVGEKNLSGISKKTGKPYDLCVWNVGDGTGSNLRYTTPFGNKVEIEIGENVVVIGAKMYEYKEGKRSIQGGIVLPQSVAKEYFAEEFQELDSREIATDVDDFSVSEEEYMEITIKKLNQKQRTAIRNGQATSDIAEKYNKVQLDVENGEVLNIGEGMVYQSEPGQKKKLKEFDVAKRKQDKLPMEQHYMISVQFEGIDEKQKSARFTLFGNQAETYLNGVTATEFAALSSRKKTSIVEEAGNSKFKLFVDTKPQEKDGRIVSFGNSVRLMKKV